MGRGLSQLQQTILRLALAHRGHGGDVTDAEVLVEHYGFPAKGQLRCDTGGPSGGHHFDAQAIGLDAYNAARAAVSRAMRRLEDRGIIERVRSLSGGWHGAMLTPAGVDAATGLPVTRLPSCKSHNRASQPGDAERDHTKKQSPPIRLSEQQRKILMALAQKANGFLCPDELYALLWDYPLRRGWNRRPGNYRPSHRVSLSRSMKRLERHGLLQACRPRGMYKITDAGRTIVGNPPVLADDEPTLADYEKTIANGLGRGPRG